MKEIHKRKPIRNHLITLLTLFGILLAADICVSHAFYRPNKAKIENTFEREKSDVHISADATALAVYDNLENAEGFRDQKRKFPPHSSHFVSFDKLDYNLPIIFGLNSTTGEAVKEKLNDFLYANLMMKMLLEKYQNLQKNARELISNRMPTSKKNTAGSTSQPRNRTGQTLEPSSGKRPPIYQTRQDLNHASRRAMWRAPAIANYAYGGSHTLQKSNIESLASLTAHEKTIGRDHQELAHLSTAERGAILAVSWYYLIARKYPHFSVIMGS